LNEIKEVIIFINSKKDRFITIINKVKQSIEYKRVNVFLYPKNVTIEIQDREYYYEEDNDQL